jgi:transposase
MEAGMLGKQERWQEDLFVACSLRDLVPDDHILKRVDKVLDLTWLRDEVKDCYCADNGRPGIDPEAAVRLMLAGLFQGIAHDRKLMREAQVNLAIRWFAGYRLDEALPHHSSLTRIRQRWGAERFRRIFAKTVSQCVSADLVSGETVHVDATLIRADVSWESLTTEHVAQVLAENHQDDSPDYPDSTGGVDRPKSGGRDKATNAQKPKKRSTTDPDATMSTSNKRVRMEPNYKQHTATDDKAGVIVDVELTTGEINEGKELLGQIERIEAATGKHLKTVTADASYAHGANYKALEDRKTLAVIPPQPQPKKPKRIPARRFRYDSKHKQVRCPGGKFLTRSCRSDSKSCWTYRAKSSDCRACTLRHRCFTETASARTIVIADGYEALLRARRDKTKGWPQEKWDAYVRHRWRVEGSHGEAKTQHCLRRAVRRGTANVAIQVYLTAAVMNLKRLAGTLRSILAIWDAREAAYQQYGDGSSTQNLIYRSENTRAPVRKTAA